VSDDARAYINQRLKTLLPESGFDPVNHPPHYNQGGVECIEAIKAALGQDGFIAYCKGQVIKYLWRADHKGNALQDAEKAEWYLKRAIREQREKKGNMR